MKFSLILCTLNRINSITYCLDSIKKQVFLDYEVIIVDQSDNYETEFYVKNLDDSKIIYKHVNFKGLTKARNYALKISSGEYFCLIDDDAYYDKYYLERAALYSNPYTILSGFIFDTEKNKKFVNYKKKNDNKILGIRDILRTCPSAGLTIPMWIVKEVGFFDELFGVGSKYGSGEESDYILRAKKNGISVVYHEDLRLKHPVPPVFEKTDESKNNNKICSYYYGLGALLKKHDNQISIYLYKLEVFFKLVIKIYLLKKNKSSYIKEQLKSFLSGLRDYSAL